MAAHLTCSVCLENFQGRGAAKQPVVTDCGHVYHRICLQRSCYNCGDRCPMCNTAVDSSEICSVDLKSLPTIKTDAIQNTMKLVQGSLDKVNVQLGKEDAILHGILMKEEKVRDSINDLSAVLKVAKQLRDDAKKEVLKLRKNCGKRREELTKLQEKCEQKRQALARNRKSSGRHVEDDGTSVDESPRRNTRSLPSKRRRK